jgi:hypothetical protein
MKATKCRFGSATRKWQPVTHDAVAAAGDAQRSSDSQSDGGGGKLDVGDDPDWANWAARPLFKSGTFENWFKYSNLNQGFKRMAFKINQKKISK